MDPRTTALILVGYQIDYFGTDGILRGVVEDPRRVDQVLESTLALVRRIAATPVTIISTPIVLNPSYRALSSPVGILHTIKESGAFRAGSRGAQTVPELLAFGDRILYLSGKVGFNAFTNTTLEEELSRRGIKDVLVAGMVTSLCIDSTGRAAYERGYDVTILADCTSARTSTEQSFFCESVFPLYGRVADSSQLVFDTAPQPVG